MLLMNRLHARAVVILGAGKQNDGASLLPHKREDGVHNGFYAILFTAVVAK
ncbi:hypothetical protein ABID39_001408 [Bartonella japonica]|uniref:Uncharacterized protein n=1 Tax=Bartonella japonica TaxID=357761 RepID=A0ABV2FQ50_9HYPH